MRANSKDGEHQAAPAPALKKTNKKTTKNNKKTLQRVDGTAQLSSD